MAPQRTTAEGSHVPTNQVSDILQNLRGEHFRHARNLQGKPVASGSLSSHAHNQPTLPNNLIYPQPALLAPRSSWVPGPSPPRSWRSPAVPGPSPTLLPSQVKSDVDIINTAAWRERVLSPLFSVGMAPSSPSSEAGACSRQIYADPSPIPRLTLLCLQLIRSTCPGSDLAEVVPYIPPHLRRALLRYTAIHAPLSQTELDALCQGTAHVDTELIVVGRHNTLRRGAFRKNDTGATTASVRLSEPREAWDAAHAEVSESPLALRSLAVLSSPLNGATLLAFPPTIVHLALVHIPHRISLHRLPTICPLLVFLYVSYNVWLSTPPGASMLEEVEWSRLRKLEMVGLRECLVTPKALLELNRGRWEDVRVIQ